MTETNLVKKILRELRALSKDQIWLYKTCDRFSVGIPDIIACIDGRFVALEVKKESTAKQARAVHTRHAIQECILGLIEKSGGFSRFVYGVEGWEVVKSEIISSIIKKEVKK